MAATDPIVEQPGFREAFQAHERAERLNTGRIAAALVVFLMPAGVILDYAVYEQDIGYFFLLRLICSALAAVLWYLHVRPSTQKYYRLLGLPIALLPAFFITVMIWTVEGPKSPYYAGLNLILLAVSVVVRWSVRESIIAAASVIAMYSLACLASPPSAKPGIVINNFYFLVETAIIVVIGNYFFNRLRFREFALRFELDRNKTSLENANQKLRELDEVKSRFFANISHELRTPLTLLLAPLEMLMQRFSRSFDDDGKNLLSTMHSNGMRLLKLINDLLDLVRLESGQIVVRKEPVDIADFLKGLASSARQVADDKRIRLEVEVDPEVGLVMTDRDKLEKIILNLQFNALKFTPSGGRITIAARKSDEQLVLTVKDTGMGISPKNLPNVFSRFWQADDSSRRKYQGVGIGLALVKELTEVQEGTVAVESEEGKGTLFTIRLPYVKAEPKTETSAAESEQTDKPFDQGSTVGNQEWLANLYRRAELFPAMTAVQDSIRPMDRVLNVKGPKVLVADDEPDMLRFLKSQLQSQYQVIEAVDGQQAIEKASQFLPDIILLDMMMPEKDGLQACKELRERTHTQSIPVILLTARADEATKLAALQAGASDFLPKPFSTTELHVRVKNLVESHHYQQKLSKQNLVLEGTIEQLKETETQLVQTEKLASLGRMSAGIIHEINNPLNFATTGLYTLRNKAAAIAPEQREEYREILKDIEDGIARVKTIVSDLRSFSHHENEQVDQIEIAEVVTSSLRFLSHEWRDRVQITQQIAEGQVVSANKNKLIQVVVNLLQNSLDALETKQFVNEQPSISIEGRVANGRSTLCIRDNGEGIDAEHMDKIFDPFFTTKDVGQGMGLGLSICYRIVEQYGGRIAVRSERGQFCEFTLDFPDTTTQGNGGTQPEPRSLDQAI
jgi:signal transduction histidine kinase